MPIATLLLRENSNQSLKALVERAHQRKSPLLEYDLQLINCKLEFSLISKPQFIKPAPTDEGFESDIDSLSIVSSDDSFTLTNTPENGTKTTETDSANGSASSDSDTECPGTSASVTNGGDATNSPEEQSSLKKTVVKQSDDFSQSCKENFNLVDCICYTDVKFPDVLVFVIRNETFVFNFDNLKHLQNFYANFTALKAVANQKVYSNKLVGTKFNLLQRTDNNGVTHIEITRDTPQNNYLINDTSGPSSIISINTPEDCLDQLINGKQDRYNVYDIQPSVDSVKESRLKEIRSESRPKEDAAPTSDSINSRTNSQALSAGKSASIDNLLNINDNQLVTENNSNNNFIRKSWNSAENLLEAPKRPDRRRRVKYKAPQPPVKNPPQEDSNKDILSGQFVRVNVNFEPKETQKQLIIKSHLKEPHPKKLQNFNILSAKPNLTINFLSSKPKQTTTYQQFKYSEPKKPVESATLQRHYKQDSSWTSSVPRLLKKQRSKSETRNFTPMAYRYIDTTQSYNIPPNSSPMTSNIFGSASGTYGHSSKVLLNSPQSSNQSFANRLFGLSPKLKEFGSNDLKRDRWGSMSDLCFKTDSNLKSVIKKDESKKKNEKKVTFSAYTTVQVV